MAVVGSEEEGSEEEGLGKVDLVEGISNLGSNRNRWR